VSNRPIHLALALVGLAGLWACWCDTAMIWDGAYQFCCSLSAGEPFAYLSRFHSWILWKPLLWLSQWTDKTQLLGFVYGFPFCMAPFVGVTLSWWIVRRHAPHLIIWVLFGSAITLLPGQIFMINDSVFQMHLFWPVFLAAFVPLTNCQGLAMALLGVFQLSHPVGIVLCGTVAVAAFVIGSFGPPEQRAARLGWGFYHYLLAWGGIAKLLLWPDPYAAREATTGALLNTLTGVVGFPILGMILAWIAAWTLLRHAGKEGKFVLGVAGRRTLILLAIIGALWTVWAAVPAFWQAALNYRRWVAPFSLPFLAAALFEIWRGRSILQSELAFRSRVSVSLAAIFFIVLGTQSFVWARLYHRLAAEVRAWPTTWMPESQLAWTKGTALDHWGLFSQVIAVQGREPRVLLWTEEMEAAAHADPPRVAFSPFNSIMPTTLPHDWFHWERLLAALAKEEKSTASSSPNSNVFAR